MVGVIKRKDYLMGSNILRNVVCFCKDCDPNGEGGRGGKISSCERDDMWFLSKHNNYCPTCGKRINWNDVTVRDNYLR